MEEQWIVDRGQLRDLLLDQPHLCYRELAQIVGRSLSWVKKWVPRLRQFPNDDCVLERQTSPRTYTRPSRNPLVVRKILDIRDHPPDGLRRVPGPKAILYFLHKDQDLQAAGVPIPRSTRAIWQVLVDHQRIVRPVRYQHTPLPLAAPMQHWQCDFKAATTAKPPDSRKRSHQVEILNVIDTGTSIALDSLVRTDFNAETAILSLANMYVFRSSSPRTWSPHRSRR